MIKRIFLFLLVNFLVIVSISTILNIFNIAPYLTQRGIDYGGLLLFCFLSGSVGSLISLLMSKVIAKKLMKVRVIDNKKARQDWEVELVSLVYQICQKAGLKNMPEIGIFPADDINAFATGYSKNNALIAFSTGLLDKMDKDQIEGVIAHEVAHITNGDMLTMALIQGVVNSFVLFLARGLAYSVTSLSNRKPGFLYFILVWIFEIALMLLGSIVIAWFSRQREYRADKGGSLLVGREKMIKALEGLVSNSQIKTDKTMAIMKISGEGFSLFSTHPKLSDRIKALRR